ncbi:MAG TPA: hypothetical protein PK466_01055 [Thermotogota bacterium]|nr:hypothetical protein [Thermotogota bacterium]HPJ87672.1 hypothetical protein [Thermotogota bacterium]HPR94889.1 hypothetical protein [Thermotogota bacterium]
MVYPAQRPPTYRKRKKKKKKMSMLPFIIIIIIILICTGVGFLYFSYSRLSTSKAMTDDTVDYLFYLSDREEVYFIRTDLSGRINYLISFPKISYEPIMAISVDLETPKEMFRSVEKLFGSSDLNYYASIDEKAFEKIMAISDLSEDISYETLTIDQFADVLDSINLNTFEFMLYGKTEDFISILVDNNYSKDGGYRLLSSIKNYANKSVPMTFMTKEPVSITLTDNEGEKKQFKRLYIDDKSLETIMEFMKE